MSRLLLAAILLLHPACLLGQTVLPSDPGKAVGFVQVEEPAKWVVLSATFEPVQPTILEGGKAVVFEGSAGRYAVFAIPPGDAQPHISIVVLGTPAPPPTPVPPGPTPPDPPGPEPPPNPPVAGPRYVRIFRESAQATPQQARFFISLRSGLAHEYLKSKGHPPPTLFDVDSVSADGRPSVAVAAWRPWIDKHQRPGQPFVPVLVIADVQTNKVLYDGPINDGMTADRLVELLKQHGG